MGTKISWSERVNTISVNPAIATLKDIAQMASDIQAMKLLLIDWEKWEGDMIIDGTEICIDVMKSSNMDKLVLLQQRRVDLLKPEL